MTIASAPASTTALAAATEHLVARAAHTQPLHSRQGLMQRFFSYWFDSFVYNQIWEDPRVDVQALQLDGNSRILAIASGGCNVLNYLIEKPAHITAVDINRYHIFLTRLKLAALQHLPDHESFFSFFGCADLLENLDNYRTYIRAHLEPTARTYWDGGSWWRRRVVGPPIQYFANNFYNYAKLGQLLRFVHWIGRLNRRDPRQLLQARTIQEQRLVFSRTISPFFNHRLIRLILRQPLVMYSLGIPPQQYAIVAHEQGDVCELYHNRLRRLVCDFPVADNYFAWQALSRGYDRTDRRAIPDYLRAEHFSSLQAHAHRVDTVIAPLTEHLRRQPHGAYNRFVLLDAQDWMTAGQLTELWSEIRRVAPVGSRIIFRTGGVESVIEAALPSELRAHFHYEQALSRELFQQDRAGIYGGFHVYAVTA